MNKGLEALESIIWRLSSLNEDLEPRETEKIDIDNIKKDLEAYEQLKKDYNKTLISNGELCVKVCELEKENKKLKEKYKRRAETSKELNEALKQHQKAIEILKEYNLTISYIPGISRPHLTLNDYGDGVTLTQEKYDLLKEVL